MRISCIYFLFLKGKLIYVGRTKNLSARFWMSGFGNYDLLRWIECDPDKLLEYKRRIIKIMKPQPLDNCKFKKPSWFYYYECMVRFDYYQNFNLTDTNV